MAMRNGERAAMPTVGASSLLVSFAVLCLTVFALLALATVQADARLADASAQAVVNYYTADCEAQRVLAQLRAGQLPAQVEQQGDRYFYTCPMGETQQLQVEIQKSTGGYRIVRWQAEPSAVWEADETLDLWDGN
jgi:hypothetical protein